MIPSEWRYRVPDKALEQFDCIKILFLHPATTGIVCATANTASRPSCRPKPSSTISHPFPGALSYRLSQLRRSPKHRQLFDLLTLQKECNKRFSYPTSRDGAVSWTPPRVLWTSKSERRFHRVVVSPRKLILVTAHGLCRKPRPIYQQIDLCRRTPAWV
jgi:hypothetical protein